MISLRNFQGEYPRAAAHLLPDNAAQVAMDCDFAHGDLRPLKAPFILKYMATAIEPIVQSLYTEDGLRFFSSEQDVSYIKCPTLGDQFGRVYYANGTEVRVAQFSSANQYGGNPGSSWKAGVPAPSLAGVTAINRSSLPDNAVLEWKFFYEANGLKYQEQNVSPSVVILGREYFFNAPQITTVEEGSDEDDPPAEDRFVTGTADAFKATPSDAVPCVFVRGINPTTNAEIFRAFSTNSSFAAGNDTDQFNGVTIELTALQGGTVTVKFGYGGGFQQTRAFVVTSVNIFGEESAPSAPLLVSYDIMQYPRVQITAPVSNTYLPIAFYKIYGTVTATTGDADYLFIETASWSWGTVSIDITTKPEAWGDVIETKSHLPPPADLHGLCLVNGIGVGFRKNEVWFAQPFKPWAWRPQDAISLPFGIISTIVHGGQVIVTTTANPYIISGMLPESMSERKLDAIQAGVSRRSLVDCGQFAAYASNDGICTITASQASMEMSFSKFDRETWLSRYSSSDLTDLTLSYHDGALIGTFPSRDGFVWRFDDGNGLFSQSTVRANGAFILPQADALYLGISNGVYQYRGGALLTATWKSKAVILSKPANMTAAQLVSESGATVSVYADAVLRHTETVAAGAVTFRIPSGRKGRKWEYQIQTSGAVTEFHVAETRSGLIRV